MTDWNPLEQPADSVILAGETSPGICEVDAGVQKRDYDERRGPALSGARLVYRGTKLVRFTLRIKLYTVADWDGWNAWSRLVERPPDGTRPGALDIEHPQLEALGVTSCVIEELGQAKRTSDDGEWTIEIKCIEHRPPAPALVGVDGSESQATTDPLDREIERNSAEIARLTSEGLGAAAVTEAGL